MASFEYTINPPIKGAVANSKDLDQTLQNAASGLGLHCIRYRNLYNEYNTKINSDTLQL